MRKSIISAVASLVFSLGACSTLSTDSSTFVTTFQNDVQAISQAVTGVAKTVCGFAPTVETVAGIVVQDVFGAGGAATAVTVGDIANSICSAVTATPSPTPAPVASLRAARRNGAPYVGSVPVHGTFIGGPNVGRTL
jgi:hypothetical protein